VPPPSPSTQIYFKAGCLETALGDLRGKRRAFIVTDKPLYDLGFADKVTHTLDGLRIAHQASPAPRPAGQASVLRRCPVRRGICPQWAAALPIV
jgi:acetaldehyde dehydrogenase/alcohol dehydrogenase